MRRLATLAVLIAAAGAPLALAQNSGKTPPSPIDFDPANPEPVVGWWTNGKELLRLETNGAYQLWITQDRYQRPVEVGAWRRSNYVYFELEPYRVKAGTRIKLQLIKEDGETKIDRPGTDHFRRIPVPPRVFADEAIGGWSAPNEQLLVLDSGRYEYRRTATIGVTQHSGIWRTDGEILYLAPDSPVVDTIRLQGVRDKEGKLELATANGRFTRVRPQDPPLGDAAPAGQKPAAPTPAAVPPGAPARGQDAPSGTAPNRTAPPASGAGAPSKPPANG
jgi:hypothetical protein